MSSKCCCVPRCVESQGLHKILHLFPNPKNEIQRFRTWIYAIGGDILGLSNEYIYKHRRVCHAHFEEKYCCRNSRISNIAVPTLLMPGSLSQPIFTFTETRPLREIQNLPSTSKDTVAVVHDMSSKVPEHTLEVNTTMDLFHDPTEKTINNPTAMVPNESSKVPEHTLEVNSTMDLVHDTTEKTINDSVTVEMVPDVSNKVPEHTLEVDSTKTTVNRRALKKSRIIASKKVFTASEHKLYQKIVKMRSQLSKSRSKVKKQSASLKAAKKLTSNPAFIAAIDKLPNTAKILTMLQLREVRKKDKGRRFSVKEKIIALSILKQSPKCYRFLRKIFILPAPQTLTKLINQANVKPRINKKIFLQIKEATASLKVAGSSPGAQNTNS